MYNLSIHDEDESDGEENDDYFKKLFCQYVIYTVAIRAVLNVHKDQDVYISTSVNKA